MNDFLILTINPGSTSTKIALFRGEEAVFSTNVKHDADTLAQFPDVSSQLSYRRATILSSLEEAGISLEGLCAVVGRGGGLLPCEGGTYEINATLLDHARRGANGVQHPAQLGPQLAFEFSTRYNCKAFVVNPPDTDELQREARMTGVKGMYRRIHLHALNLKETAIRHSDSIGKKYEDANYVVCHIGGGISISAHRKGRMVDGTDIVGGEGPMTPTRCGAVPASEIIRYCFESGADKKKALGLCMKNGGFVSHLGTSDAQEVFSLSKCGNEYAKLIWDTMVYQIEKSIGAMAAVLHGQVDGILLGGGIVHNQELVEHIIQSCGWIAPVSAYPGEFEMEAMCAGACRVLSGREEAKEYSGIPAWSEDMLLDSNEVEK